MKNYSGVGRVVRTADEQSKLKEREENVGVLLLCCEIKKVLSSHAPDKRVRGRLVKVEPVQAPGGGWKPALGLGW